MQPSSVSGSPFAKPDHIARVGGPQRRLSPHSEREPLAGQNRYRATQCGLCSPSRPPPLLPNCSASLPSARCSHQPSHLPAELAPHEPLEPSSPVHSKSATKTDHRPSSSDRSARNTS